MWAIVRFGGLMISKLRQSYKTPSVKKDADVKNNGNKKACAAKRAQAWC
jgi:hypothetical protein